MPDTEQFNADELEAPAWLNAQFITDVLRTYEKCPDLQVTDLKITPASAQGDHYASVMFRTTAEYTTSMGKFCKPLIIKTMPEQEGHKKDMLSDSHFFSTEIKAYTTALPEFERILREAGDGTKLFVPCVYHSLEPRQVIIFEDLVPQGRA
ncbi:GD21208 [Drosophila simulans]|uniref:GD21208 n=1 Tax=Drosophila simulans TaxID=7240 RepID=B4QUT5_DROSI|nr:GD21208 [Drosophila simulans]